VILRASQLPLEGGQFGERIVGARVSALASV